MRLKSAKLIVISVLLLSSSAAQADFEKSVGFGPQYGGLVGFQGAYYFSDVKANFGLGYLGVSTGLEYFPTAKHSIGGYVFVSWVSGYALSYSYYFNGKNSAGWRIGLDIGRYELGFPFDPFFDNAFGGVFDDALDNEETFILPTIGYSFSF